VFRFNNIALFTSSGDSFSNQSLSGSVRQLDRVQSCSIGLDFPSQNIQFLDLKSVDNSIENPVINLNFDFFTTNGKNERFLGLFTNITGNAFKKIDEPKNFYITYLNNSFDYNSYKDQNENPFETICLGNGLLNSLSISASVGDLMRTTFSYEGLNANIVTGARTGISNPAININDGQQLGGTVSIPFGEVGYQSLAPNSAESVVALARKDISLYVPNSSLFGLNASGSNSILLQGFDLSVSINRNRIKSLGELHPQRDLVFPIEVNLSANAIIDKYQQASFSNLVCATQTGDFSIIAKQSCDDASALEINLKGLNLVSQNITNQIGSLASVDLQWKGYINSFGTGGTNISLFASQGNQYYVLDYINNISGYDQFGNLFFTQEQFWKQEISENNF
jgi:hypothetical protein